MSEFDLIMKQMGEAKGYLQDKAKDATDPQEKARLEGLAANSRQQSVTHIDIEQTLKILDELERRKNYGGHLNWFVPGTPYGIDKLPKHAAFFEAGSKYKVRALISSNRSGKSQATTFEVTCHLTGIYPDWWQGKRFDRPIKAWAAGISWGQVKEAIQEKFLGKRGNEGTGLLTKEQIVKLSSAAGTPGAVESVIVRHVSGGNSILSLKTYEQGIRAFQGAEVDVIILDEEPSADIYSECVVRTMTTNGIVLFSFTPQMGLTHLLTNIYKDADLLCGAEPLSMQAVLVGDAEDTFRNLKQTEKFVAIIQIFMDDAPWLSIEEIEIMMATCPAHLRDSRRYGRVTIGEGTVFPIEIDQLIVQPFQVPKEWKRVYGLDVGWAVTAAEWIAHDADNDIVYVYSEHMGKQQEPLVHAHSIKQRGEWIVGCIDYAANARGVTDGKKVADEYRKHGLKLVNAEKAVDASIFSLWERMCTGRLKIFSTCTSLLKELPIYRRDAKGKIIKEHDHQIDALRYAHQGLKHARATPTSNTMGSSSGPFFKDYKV